MCGRYASSRSPEDLAEEFEVVDPRLERALPPDYNVAPTKEVYAVMDRVPRADGEGAGERASRRPTRCASSVCCAGAWCRPGPRTPASAAG
ncbi:SOS response-associated peptidase family protein [Nocardioides sambongensis]|uniref:SOS response-associated peptidase family protein n=1 Tax=Nocardioides sambongensis TaxID=2589074 RepID=UPI002F26DA0B